MSLKTGFELNGIYRVVRLLGKGAMGNVYLVERIKDDRQFVIKELIFTEAAGPDKKTARELFLREAEFMGKFDHQGLPKTYGTFSQDENDYLVMDYIEGKTLEEIITSEDKPLTEEKAVIWTIELCKIIDYLHNFFHSPIVYRDLKPSNIIITPENKAKLVDFGIARYYNPDKNTDTFSYGSPGYAAPEQYKGRGQSSPQTDIFGLGVILFQMLTKYDPTLKPFSFPQMTSLNPSVSPHLADIVKRAIELKPLKRYISILEFKEELEKYVRKYKSSFKSEKITSKKSPLFFNREIIPLYSIVIIFGIIGLTVDFLGQVFPKLTITMLVIGTFILIFTIISEKVLYSFTERPYSYRITILELIIVMAIVFTLSAILMPNFQCYNATQHSIICGSNLRNMATALEMYSEDNEGLYPPALEYLTRNYNGEQYMLRIPECPHYNSSYGYRCSSAADEFTLWCDKPDAHRSYRFYTDDYVPEGECWPQYSSGEGILFK